MTQRPHRIDAGGAPGCNSSRLLFRNRVVPAHSFKFAARLQEYHRGNNPVLLPEETRAGHGAGKPTSMLIEEAADRLAFALKELDVKP